MPPHERQSALNTAKASRRSDGVAQARAAQNSDSETPSVECTFEDWFRDQEPPWADPQVSILLPYVPPHERQSPLNAPMVSGSSDGVPGAYVPE